MVKLQKNKACPKLRSIWRYKFVKNMNNKLVNQDVLSTRVNRCKFCLYISILYKPADPTSSDLYLVVWLLLH